MRSYLTFLFRVWRLSFQGSGKFYAWMTVLTVLSLVGLNAWARQFVVGLETTGMTNQVSWGAYIANFTFLVGVAAAAVMLVIPAYVYDWKPIKEGIYELFKNRNLESQVGRLEEKRQKLRELGLTG